MWEARNPLGAALSALGLLESGALVLEMERQLNHLADNGNLAELDTYVAERAFVTHPGGWIGQARKERPVDLLRAIDEADRVCPGMRFCYDRLAKLLRQRRSASTPFSVRLTRAALRRNSATTKVWTHPPSG